MATQGTLVIMDSNDLEIATSMARCVANKTAVRQLAATIARRLRCPMYVYNEVEPGVLGGVAFVVNPPRN